MALLLDAGAFIAIERRDPEVMAHLRRGRRLGVPIRTTSAVVAQVWRGGPRQAQLAQLVNATDERPLDDAAARRIGRLLGEAGVRNVVDASIVDLASDGDEVLTSDPADLAFLAGAIGKRVVIRPVG